MGVRNPMADSADQIMFGVNTYLTDQGLMKARVEADTAYMFEDNNRVELRTLRMTFFTSTGERNAVLTSREGTYNTRLNQADARGNVILVSEDGRRLETEQLRYSQIQNTVSSDSQFVLTEPARRVEGIGFTSDPDLRNIQIHRLLTGQTGTIQLP